MLRTLIKKRRMALGLKLRELAASTSIDQTLLSRFEQGSRLPTEGQLVKLSQGLDTDLGRMRVEWIAERLLKMVRYEQHAVEALQLAESRVEYLVRGKVSDPSILEFDLQKKLDQLDVLKKTWLNKQPLNRIQLKKLNEFFDIEYTFESNRIEGNTLTLQETALVINEGLTIGGKSISEHLEAINHADAIDFVRRIVNGKEDLSRRVLLEIHRLILKGVDEENSGRYRTVPVRISGSDLELPQPYLLDKLMEDYFDYYQLNRARLHPVILAAEMHERLVSIHPFIDGNGRTARLVMNLILLRNGYTRANIKGEDESRLAYYRALQAVQKDNQPSFFYELVINEALRSMQDHLSLT